MADRSKKKTSPVKGGAAANPAAMATVASHKDDTVKVDVNVETNSEAEKVEDEVKTGGEAKIEETIVEQNEESTVQVDPEFEAEQKRAARKSTLRLLLTDNPTEVLAHPLSDEDRELIAELIAEQGNIVKEYSVTTEQLAQEKDALEYKLDAANSKIANVSKFISATVTETVGQVGKETATAIDGLNATVVEHFGKQNGVKNAVTTIGDQVSKDMGMLKGKINSTDNKVDEVKSSIAVLAEKVDGIKVPSSSPPAQSNNVSSHWPWVVVVGFLLAAVTIIAVFFLSKDTKIEVQVQQAPAGNTMKIVPPVPGGDAARATSQQVVPGGPSNPLVPSIIIGANPADPCEGLTGKANGECAMNQRRPKDFPDQDWNTVLTVFAEPASVGLEGGLEACRKKYLRATDNEDFALECEAAVKCLVSSEEKRRDCWRIATESFGTKLGMTN